MLIQTLRWCLRLLIERLCLLAGAKKHYVLDPLFFTPIDCRFKRKVIASPLWTASVFAEKLLTKCGVCVDVSVITGVLDPSITRAVLVAGYADMCVAVGLPCFGWNFTGVVLSKERFATAPLPVASAWILVGEDERIRYAALLEGRALLRRQNEALNRRLISKVSRTCLPAMMTDVLIPACRRE
jgi:hypothetical protein